MVREISAGGVVIRNVKGMWRMAIIELPRPEADGSESHPAGAPSKPKLILALPKGLVDPGETPVQAALREVREETGLTAAVVTKLADIKYVYVRSWSDKERVFKI